MNASRDSQPVQNEPRVAAAKKRFPGSRPKFQISHNARSRAFQHG